MVRLRPNGFFHFDFPLFVVFNHHCDSYQSTIYSSLNSNVIHKIVRYSKQYTIQILPFDGKTQKHFQNLISTDKWNRYFMLFFRLYPNCNERPNNVEWCVTSSNFSRFLVSCIKYEIVVTSNVFQSVSIENASDGKVNIRIMFRVNKQRDDYHMMFVVQMIRCNSCGIRMIRQSYNKM